MHRHGLSCVTVPSVAPELGALLWPVVSIGLSVAGALDASSWPVMS